MTGRGIRLSQRREIKDRADLKFTQSQIDILGRPMRKSNWNHGRRESRHARGYGRAWEKLRAQVMERDRGLCQPCLRGEPSRVTPAREVDHIRPKAKGGDDSLTNLEAICVPCHRDKSARDQGKVLRTRPRRTGPDGWPIEE